MWSHDGSERFFVSGYHFMPTAAIVDGVFEGSRSSAFLRGGFMRDAHGDPSYDVAPDGRLVVIRGTADATITVVSVWLQAALASGGGDG